MSSTYNVLCLSHDPAIRIDHDFSYTEVLAAAANPSQHEALAEHVQCDLLAGRFSYPLIQAACPGTKPHCPGYHRYDLDTWTESGWLRLLLQAHARGDNVADLDLPRCWTKTRVQRLWRELGAEIQMRKIRDRGMGSFEPPIFYGVNAQLARDMGVPVFRDGDTGEIVTKAQPTAERNGDR